MMIAVDLHIHSALSPCADDDMTPNNIVNMALLKGLDAIAITDHNSCDNVEAVMRVAGTGFDSAWDGSSDPGRSSFALLF